MPTASQMLEFEGTDLEPDAPRGRKRTRQGDICIVKQGQQHQQLWAGESATQTSMTSRNQGGRGRAVERSSSQSSQTPFENRPMLQPTPPSVVMERSRSRSQSPAHTTIMSMKQGRPKVHLDKGPTLSSAPEAVSALVKFLASEAGCAIPASMRSCFEQYDLGSAQITPESAFTTDAQLYNWRGDDISWKRVEHILRRAAKCDRMCMDEHAWCDIVRLVLELALDIAGSSDESFALEVNNVQSQALVRDLLPKTSMGRPIDRKIDFVIAVDTEEGSHIEVDLNQVLGSPMTDEYTARLPLVCGLEIKRPGGNEQEAELQLMVWQAAMLAHLEYLHEAGGNRNLPLPPVVGWTVRGHEWQFYIAWKEPSGTIRVKRLGSFTAAASTENTLSIFVLLKLLVKLFAWVKKEYYPAYRALLQQAVESLTVNVDPSDA